MSENNWKHFLDRNQLDFMHVMLASLGAFLLLSAFRDFVFDDFEPPVWITLLNVVSLAVFLIAFAVTLLKWLRPGDAKIFLAGKMVEEGPLRDTGCATEIIDSRRRKTLPADHVHRDIEQARSRIWPYCGLHIC